MFRVMCVVTIGLSKRRAKDEANLDVYLIGATTTYPEAISGYLQSYKGGKADHVTEGFSKSLSSQYDALGSSALVEVAGRICTDSEKTKERKTHLDFVAKLADLEHGSVFEHVSFSFLVTGISRLATHELIRHRHISISQRSTRYCDEGASPYILAELEHQLTTMAEENMVEELRQIATATKDFYRRLVKKLHKNGKSLRESRGLARGVLLSAQSTELVITANSRTLREFFIKRGGPAADREIRELAHRMLMLVQLHSPELFQDFVVVDGAIVRTKQGALL